MVSPPAPGQAEVDELAARFEDRPAEELVSYAAERFGAAMVLTCSWQKQSSILVHMTREAAPKTRIVALDTGVLFPETHAVRDRLIERYGIEVETFYPEQVVDRLWERDVDACCGMRKVAPLARALEGAGAWLTGIRREQSPTRAQAPKVALDARRGVVKVQPLVDWTDRDCWRYVMEHHIPYNELHDRGDPSSGCVPCTRAVGASEAERAGRWSGTSKLECGLHIE